MLNWYKQHGRDLPWRSTHNPYHIMVSEIMLQQTQVDRVKEKYTQWLQLFPTVESLAAAPTAKVLQAWAGLGYNRRALALHTAAQQIVHEHGGIFPNTVEDLMQLKGIGRYTASAIMAFAFRKPVPIVDTNVKRVLGRIFFGYKQLAELIDTDEPFWILKEKIVPHSKRAYDFNQGIMDFGAMVCTAKQPACVTCPMNTSCASYPDILTADSELLRVKRKRLEPQYFGQPRRIWRGKILQYLNTTKNHSAKLSDVGKLIQTDWESSRLQWLKEVAQTMEKDKLITITKHGNNWKIALPT